MNKLLCILLTVTLISANAHAQKASAHRGDNKNAPENTIPAIRSAVMRGAGQVEFDVYTTKDGELVVLHDRTVDRTTDGTGAVADMTLAEIKKLDAGKWFGEDFAGTQIPTFRQALEAVPEHVLCNVEIKGGPATAAKAAIIIATRGRLNQCFLTVPTNGDESIRAARAEVPDIMVCKGFPAEQEVTPDDLLVAVDSSGAPANRKIEFLQLFYFKAEPVPYDFIRKSVADLHKRGIRVNFCCASDEAKIMKLANTGVDFILTDDVDLCVRLSGKK